MLFWFRYTEFSGWIIFYFFTRYNMMSLRTHTLHIYLCKINVRICEPSICIQHNIAKLSDSLLYAWCMCGLAIFIVYWKIPFSFFPVTLFRSYNVRRYEEICGFKRKGCCLCIMFFSFYFFFFFFSFGILCWWFYYYGEQENKRKTNFHKPKNFPAVFFSSLYIVIVVYANVYKRKEYFCYRF